MIIIVKWSNTMQNNNQIKLLTVPRIPNSTICPARAISNLLALTPRGPNLPLFHVKYNQEWVPLTYPSAILGLEDILLRYYPD